MDNSELAMLRTLNKYSVPLGIHNSKIEALEEKLRVATGALEKYSNSEDMYWIERVNINEVTGEKVYITKNIIQLSKLAKQALELITKECK